MQVFGFAGWSGSGKTTLIERLLPLLVADGRRVSVVKHAHHDFDIDKPGKDSHRFRVAGSTEVLVSSATRWALMREHRGAPEPQLYDLLAHLTDCDLALVEGFKREAIPKLEVHRAANGKPLLFPDDRWIVAIASDVDVATSLPRFGLDDAATIAAFVVEARGRYGGRVRLAGHFPSGISWRRKPVLRASGMPSATASASAHMPAT